MSFSSLEFMILFFPLFCLAYYVMPARFRNVVLFLGCAAFYLFGCTQDLSFAVILAVSVIANWLLGMMIEKAPRSRRIWLAVGVILNIGTLFFFKYAPAVGNLFAKEGTNVFRDLALPLGMSFYSFRAVGYLADVARAKCYAEPNPARFALWFAFFPSVTAGPITRYPAMLPQLKERKYGAPQAAEGMRTFILGLGYKVLLADRISTLWYKVTELGWPSVSSPLAWMCVIGYSLYIYFDFAGYSLMAIGVAKILGFDLPENFRYPYASKSMTEFWRRWHITLGEWFKDYIYIPLGGSRCGKWRNLFNLLCVWLFTGIWHGSTLNFVIWGLFLFTVIAVEKLFLKKYLDKIPVLGHLYMIVLIPLSWAIFASTDLSELGSLFLRLFPFLPQKDVFIIPGDWQKYLGQYWYRLLPALLLCFGLPEKIHKKYSGKLWYDVILMVILSFSLWFVSKSGGDPFMYGNF